MMRDEFKEIFDHWSKFHHKKYLGDTKEKQTEDYRIILNTYYRRLSALNPKELEAAFDMCVDRNDRFPTINQLKQCIPKRYQEDARLPEHMPIPENVEKQIKSVKSGGNKLKKIGEDQIRRNFTLLQLTWGNTNWDEALERELKLDNERG